MRVLLACLIVLLAPTAALASEVSATYSSLLFNAAPGEVNRVTVTPEATLPAYTVRVTDSGAPLTAGDGCESIDAHTAECVHVDVLDSACHRPPWWVSMAEDVGCVFSAELGDGDDSLSVELPEFGSALMLGAGDDVLDATGTSGVFARGGEGNDRLFGSDTADGFSGGPGADFLKGRGGLDAVVYADFAEPERSGGVVVRLDDAPGDGGASEDDDIRTEQILGTAAADVLVGNDDHNLITGRGGDDRIRCRGGDDLAIDVRLRLPGKDCERVASPEWPNPPYVDPIIDGGLVVRRGRVEITLDWGSEGRLTIATLRGRRLGSVEVPFRDEPVRVSVPVAKVRRSQTVQVTGVLPGKSLSRVLAELKA